MNLTLSDSLLGRQRSRQWTPLLTQQYRLRHIHQIFGLNFPHLPRGGTYYYTLHLTTMSAPFYTSEKLENINPKWSELDLRNLPNLATTAIVLRAWQHVCDIPDLIVSTWGVNLSGLVYLGNKIAEIQPACFKHNTVIFNIRGGFFTSQHVVKLDDPKPPPFVENLNMIGSTIKHIFRKTSVQCEKSEVRDSYSVDKLRKLRSLQINIKNKDLDVQSAREKIEVKCGMNSSEQHSVSQTAHNSSPSNIRYAPQLLTMKTVNKMLEQKPTKLQRKEMEKMRNEIEIEKFRSKLLSQEKDKKSALIRHFKKKLKELLDINEKRNMELMDNYYKLNKDREKLKGVISNMGSKHELLVTLYSQLYNRRRQLLQQLLFIYPIQHIDHKYTIHGIYVPNSDVLQDCSDAGIAVALGHITHVLLMSSTFLQVPLRYPMTHYGSRSYITDFVSSELQDRQRDFPLFTKGKERMQFTYAVYLLNKNIAQLRWFFFMHTPELKATLSNLLAFLEGRDCKEQPWQIKCSLGLKIELENVRENVMSDEGRFQEVPKRYSKIFNNCECGPGLSEILAVPEAFMNKQISSDLFKNYVVSRKFAYEKTTPIVIKEGRVDEDEKNCDNNEEAIEQGTDLLDPALNLSDLDGESFSKQSTNGTLDQNCCFVEKECSDTFSEATIDTIADQDQTELSESWKKNGVTSDCCSNEEHFPAFPDVPVTISISTVQSVDSPLMARTDALLNTKSFNLVKPKPNL